MGGGPEVDSLGRGQLGRKNLAGSLKGGRMIGGKRRGGNRPCAWQDGGQAASVELMMLACHHPWAFAPCQISFDAP